MGYVTNNLSLGESILCEGKMHWFLWARAVAALFLDLAPVVFSLGNAIPTTGGILTLLGAYWTYVWLRWIFTELAITNQRVFAKFGIISTSTVELNHAQVESIQFKQGIFGRLLGYGTLAINGTGRATTPIPFIENPMEFRRIAVEQIEKAQSQRTNA